MKIAELFKPFLLLIILLLLESCASAKYTYDFDEDAPFTAYKTYNLYPDLQVNLSELDSTRLIIQLENGLQEKGFIKSNNPQFYVNVQSYLQKKLSNSSVGVGVGGGNRGFGFNIGSGIPINTSTLIQQIKIDFVDVLKDELFWQSIYEGKYRKNISPSERIQYYNGVIQKSLANYPPKRKTNAKN